MGLVDLGQAAGKIQLQQTGHPLGQAVVFAIADGAPVGIAQPLEQKQAVERFELQLRHQCRGHRLAAFLQQFGARLAPLFAHYLVKVGGASGVEAKARRGDEPAPAILPIDEAIGLQLHQRLADGDPGGAVEFPQQPLGGELVVGDQAPRQDLVGEGILDLQVLGFAHENPWLGNGWGAGPVAKWRRYNALVDTSVAPVVQAS